MGERTLGCSCPGADRRCRGAHPGPGTQRQGVASQADTWIVLGEMELEEARDAMLALIEALRDGNEVRL